jgi:hypothetical protein
MRGAGFAAGSLALLALSMFFLVSFTMFESVLVGIPSGTERVITFLLLVLPAAAGAVLGTLSLIRREGRTGLAILGAVSNALFALFHLALILFAG